MSSSEQQRCCAGPSPCNSGRRRWFQSCIVRPTTGRDCCWRTAATVDESTPPDIAIATRPGCVSALTGRVSNWVSVGISFTFILAGFRHFAIGGGEFAELGDGGGNGFECV